MAVVNNKWKSLHYASAGDVQAGRMVVKTVSWAGMTTDGHTMTMKNSAGDIVFGPIEASSELSPQIFDVYPMYVDGLEVDVLGSGVVDVILA